MSNQLPIFVYVNMATIKTESKMGNAKETQKIVDLILTGDEANISLALNLQKQVQLDMRTIVEARLDMLVKFEVKDLYGKVSTHTCKLSRSSVVDNRFEFFSGGIRKYRYFFDVVKIHGIFPPRKKLNKFQWSNKMALKIFKVKKQKLTFHLKAKSFEQAFLLCFELQKLHGLKGEATYTKSARYVSIKESNIFFDFYCNQKKEVTINFK
jgi:hypothetical protein